MGFYRQAVPLDHPEFGKPVKCDNPIHHEAQLQKMSKLSGLLPGDLTRKLSDIYPNRENVRMLKAARKMINNPTGWLYLYGSPGNAKTEVLIASVNEINQAGKGPAMYLKFSTLLNYMRDAFSEIKYRTSQIQSGKPPDEFAVGNYLTRFNRLKEIKVLAIDEFDKVNVSTNFAEEFRFDFFDERYHQAIHGETATIFASQTGPNDPSMPEPLSSRLNDGRFTVIKNEAGDARPDMTG